MPNHPPRSLPPKMLNDGKLSLSDVDTEDEATLEGDHVSFAAVPVVVTSVDADPPATPLIELEGINIVIYDPVVDREKYNLIFILFVSS